MEEGEGEDEDGGDSRDGWRNTLVFTMTLSQKFVFVMRSYAREIRRAHALT